MEFSRQEYWSGLPFPPPGELPDPGIEHTSPMSPALAGGFFATEPPGKPDMEVGGSFLNAGGSKRERDREGGGKTLQKEKTDNAAQTSKDKRQDARRPWPSQGMAAGTRIQCPLLPGTVSTLWNLNPSCRKAGKSQMEMNFFHLEQREHSFTTPRFVLCFWTHS